MFIQSNHQALGKVLLRSLLLKKKQKERANLHLHKSLYLHV